MTDYLDTILIVEYKMLFHAALRRKINTIYLYGGTFQSIGLAQSPPKPHEAKDSPHALPSGKARGESAFYGQGRLLLSISSRQTKGQ